MPKATREKSPERNRNSWILGLSSLLLFMASSGRDAYAVTSKIHRQSTGQDLLAGEPNGVVIGSRGTIRLGRSAQVLVDKLDGVWSINCLVAGGGTIYFGTSPNGGVYKYAMGQVTKLYPMDPGPDVDPEDPNDTDPEESLTNEHIFALAMDLVGRLLIGISGQDCRLCRFSAGGGMEVLVRPKDARYIFAIASDEAGNLYVGTGPQGKVYRLDAMGKTAQLVYDCSDRNILSLAVAREGFVYAGSDTRGLIYKINPRDQTATALYDSSLPEIPALCLTESLMGYGRDLYAMATAAQKVQGGTEIVPLGALPGRPEPAKPIKEESAEGSQGGKRLTIANAKREPTKPASLVPPPARKGRPSSSASVVYRVTKDGYVREVANDESVFLCMAQMAGSLLVGTGNDGRLLSVDPSQEQQSILYEDPQASQVTSVIVVGDEICLGTANPAKVIRLGSRYALEGIYVSDLVDARQPANWGKLQIDADVPAGCEVWASTRSGNVEDVNDPTFSAWTTPVKLTEPTALGCPLGRFCQYRLILKSGDGIQTPIIREVALASTIPNLAPIVESVDVTRSTSPTKIGLLKIAYRAKDGNDDKLLYEIDFRKLGHTGWIKVKDQVEEEDFEWDSRTVEDGRYEVRVVAGDERGNSPVAMLTGARISDPVVVDNTAPTIRGQYFEKRSGKTTMVLLVSDKYSMVGQVEYAIDSATDWKSAAPDDLVYDTTDESLTIEIEDLASGEHVIAVKVSDDLGNTAYRSFEIPADPTGRTEQP